MPATESLMMWRPHLEDLPSLPSLPDGHVLRLATIDDRSGLQDLLQAAFPEMEWSAKKVEEALYADENVAATFVIEFDGHIVATASALLEPSLSPATGTLHWVAVHPSQTGKRLGFLISLAVLQEFVRLGRTEALLRTDDARLPAIKTYLNLGFQPDRATPERAIRWDRVMEQFAAYRQG